MGTRLGIGIGVALLTVSALAQAPASPKPSAKVGYSTPRTPWGESDLRGTYTTDNSIGVPFECPSQYGDRAMLTDEEFVANEKANLDKVAKDNHERPETPFEQDEAANNAPRHWLERGRFARQNDAAEFHSYYDRCITRGVTGSILPAIHGNGTRIDQGPGYVVIRNEMIHEDRVIPTNSQAPRLGKNIQLYMGDPRGHWEGSTLVVDSTNFTDKIGVGGGSLPSTSLHLVERLTRTAPGTIRYEFTVDDPETFTAKWTAALDLTMKPGYEIYEYACHEGNYGLRNMLSASRADDRAAK